MCDVIPIICGNVMVYGVKPSHALKTKMIGLLYVVMI